MTWCDTLCLWWADIITDPSAMNYMFNGINFTQFVKIVRGPPYARRNRKCDIVEFNDVVHCCQMQCLSLRQSTYIDEFAWSLYQLWKSLRHVTEVVSLERFITEISKRCQ